MLEDKCRMAKPVALSAIHVENEVTLLQAQVATLLAQIAELALQQQKSAPNNEAHQAMDIQNPATSLDTFSTPLEVPNSDDITPSMTAEEKHQRIGLRAANLGCEDKGKGKGKGKCGDAISHASACPLY